MTETPTIACFDGATTVGYAVGPVGGKPELGTWNLRAGGPDRPERLLYLSRLLHAYYKANRVDYAFVEAPMPIAVMMDIGASDDTVQMLRGVVTIIEVVSLRAGIPIAWWRVQEARKAVLGRATFPRGTAKAEVMKFCKMLGHAPADDNSADALVGWLYESARFNPRLAAAYTPLFSWTGDAR